MSGRRSPFKKASNRFVLQERDKQILLGLYHHRFLTNDQIQSLFNFGCKTRVNVRLRKLFDNEYLSRHFLSHPYGRAKIIYFIGPKAVSIISEKLNPDPVMVKRKRRLILKIKESSLEHSLLINNFRLAFVLAIRGNPEIKLESWKTQKEIVLKSETQFYPDAYFKYSDQNKPYNFFLEIDRFIRSNQCFEERLQGYLKYGLEGYFTQQYHYNYFRVLIVCPGQKRLTTLLKITSRITDKMFWFTTQEMITSEKILDKIWLRPQREGKFSLLEVK